MSIDDLNEKVSEALTTGRNRWTAIYIAFLAVLIAVSSMGGNNADKDAMGNNIFAANMFAFFQAKNIRQTDYEIARDDLLLLLAMTPDMPAEARSQIQKKIAAYSAKIARYASEPEKGEGKKELLAKARKYEKRRDRALRQDPYFDYAQAFLQIAIVLASVSLISGGAVMLVLSGVATVIGSVLMINGFTLIADVPLSLPW